MVLFAPSDCGNLGLLRPTQLCKYGNYCGVGLPVSVWIASSYTINFLVLKIYYAQRLLKHFTNIGL